MINSEMYFRAKYDIAYFASVVLNKPFTDEHLLAIRLYSLPIAGELKRTSVMAPRQFGMTTLFLLAALHRGLFHNEESVIVVPNNNIMNNMTFMVDGLTNSIKERFNIHNLPKKVIVMSGDSVSRHLHGKRPTQIFVDCFASVKSDAMDAIYRLAANFPKTQLHLSNSGYTPAFFDLPGEYVKLHITRPLSSEEYIKHVRTSGEKFAMEEWIGVKYQPKDTK